MYDFIVIGGAQSGLAISYYLKKLNKKFLIVDKAPEIGHSWLKRWDSLTLFTPTEYNHLPGMDFPQPDGYYPNKNEVAEYFKTYAKKFDFDVQLNTLITKIKATETGYKAFYDDGFIDAKGVIVATGPFHIPYTPEFAHKIDSHIFQTHSNSYKNKAMLQEGATLVVGDGDSGYQILDEISKTGRKTYFSGDPKVGTLPQEFLGKTLWWWFEKLGLLSANRESWLGKILIKRHQPIIGTDVKGILKRKNVTVVGRTVDAEGQTIITKKQKLSDVTNIIWATGYKPNFEWIEGLDLKADGYPENYRGISNLRNLYFIGLPWLYTRGSATLGGVKKDAAYISKDIAHSFGWKRFGRLGVRQ